MSNSTVSSFLEVNFKERITPASDWPTGLPGKLPGGGPLGAQQLLLIYLIFKLIYLNVI